MFSLNDVGFLGTVSPALDADAAAYIAAVEAADTQALETNVRIAINAFIVGCKADGIWTAIKASCILAGARTLTGALVPLAGAAPTNVSGLFVSGDYNRKTGLVGNGSTKYLNSNRNNATDPQNSVHNTAYVSTLPTTGTSILGAGAGNAGSNDLTISAARNRNSTADGFNFTTNGFLGMNRSLSTGYSIRVDGTTANITRASQSPNNSSIFVFARNLNGSPTSFADPRLAFYSIGESLDLALLDARVTTLINAIAAAIP
jgi:hypothetical protein